MKHNDHPSDHGFLLELDTQCVETTARQLHRRLVVEACAGQQPPRLAETLELLTEFLETSDFPEMRASFPELSGGRRVALWIYRDARGRPRWSSRPAEME